MSVSPLATNRNILSGRYPEGARETTSPTTPTGTVGSFLSFRNDEHGNAGNAPWDPETRKLFGVIPVSRSIVPYFQMLGYFKDMPYVCRLLEKKNMKSTTRSSGFVRSWREYYRENARVFVTFEYEDAQRACLKAMSTGTIPALDIKKTDVDRILEPAHTDDDVETAEPDRPHEFVGIRRKCPWRNSSS